MKRSECSRLLKHFWVLLALVCSSQTLSAQSWNLVWREDFGVAEDTVIKDFPDPSMTVPNHCFYANKRVCLRSHSDESTNYQNVCDEYGCEAGDGECGTIDDGYYGIANSTWWAYNRFVSCKKGSNISHFIAGRDHTGNKNGAMLIINTGTGAGEIIYKQDVEFDLCDSRKYRFIIYSASITNLGYKPVYPNLTLRVLNTTTGELIKELDTGDIPNWKEDTTANFSEPGGFGDPTAERVWGEYYVEFTANDGDKLSLQVINNCKGGTGNDFVLDDISLLRYDEEDVPDPIISATTIAKSSSSSADACSYLASFSVPEDVLTTWKKLYDKIYFLWQKSEDDGVTWNNVLDVSGVEKREVEIEMDKSVSTIFRVIITGGATNALAQEQALYIAENGGPKGGCAYFSISNTLGAKPEADCTYSSDLKALFNDDFGFVPEETSTTSDYCPLTYAEKGLKSGNYAVTASPYYTQQNSWDGIPEFADLSGTTTGGLLYCRTNNETGVIYERKVNGPFCNCKSYIFVFNAAAIGEWSTLKLKAVVLDDSGDVLASLPISKSNNGKAASWESYQVEFTPENDYTGSITVQIVSTDDVTYEYGTHVVLDNISVVVCGEHVPQDSIYINGTPGQVTLADFDCNAKPAPTIDISSMSGWTENFPNNGFVWQSSTDGGLTWTLLADRTKTISYENDEGGEKLYRAIIAETYSLAKQVAAGTLPDGCGTYLITNTVSLTCKEMCEFGADKLVLWKDDFGSVPSGTRKTSANLKGHTYTSDMSVDINDGYYAVVSRVQDAGSWFAGQKGTDHTGNADGGFIVINVNPDYKGKVIYEQELGFTTCANTMYYFSLWAGSISKKVANGDASGVLCNLLLEIVDAATGDVLGQIETGDIPNAASMNSTIPWSIYGVSFMATGEKVILRVIDNAGNGKKGNDLAIDDISLIACQTKAPSISLEADGSQDVVGVCGDSVTLSLPDMTDWETYYPKSVYTLWQRSLDGGETWETLPDGGLEVSQITVALEKNKQILTYETADGSSQYDSLTNIGILYRAIVAGPESDVTQQIVDQGYPDNGCYLYAISNISTLKCDCVDPVFTFSDGKKNKEISICNDTDEKVTFTVKQTGTTNVDSLNWYSRTDTTAAWTLIEDNQSLSLEVLPTDTTYYMFVGINDDCHSDSLYATVNVNKAIKLDTIATDTLCVGSVATLTAVLAADNEGTPTAYVWNNVSGANATYNIASLAADTDVKLTATDGVCTSNEITAKIIAETPFQIAESIAQVDVCGYEAVSFDSKAVGPNIQWSKSTDGISFAEIAGANEAVYSFVADGDAYYKAVVSGVDCPSKEVTAKVTVTLPEALSAELKSETKACESSEVTIEATVENVNNLVLVYREDENSLFAEKETKTLDGTAQTVTFTVPITKTTQFRVQSPNANNCPSAASDVMTVTIEKPVSFEMSISDEAFCQEGNVTVEAKLDENSGEPYTMSFTDGTNDLTDQFKLKSAGVYAYTGKVTVTTTYNLTMGSEICTATPTGTETVAVEFPAELTLTSDLTTNKICEGTSFNMTLTTNSSVIEWQTSADGVTYTADPTLTATDLTPTITPTANVWYKVVSAGTGVCGAVVSDIVSVKVEPKVTFELTGDVPAVVCKGTSVSKTIAVKTGEVSKQTWTRQLTGETAAPLASTLKMTDVPTASATYVAEVFGDVCPSVTDQFSVEVEQPATINSLTVSAKAVCKNTDVVLTVDQSDATELIWEAKTEADADFVEFDNVLTDTHSYTVTGTTRFRVKTAQASVCENAMSSIVTVTSEDSIKLSLPSTDPMICQGSVVNVNCNLLSGTPSSILWQRTLDGATSAETVGNSLVLNDVPEADATYTLTVNSAVCPEETASFSVAVEQKPTIKSLRISTNNICVNSDVDLTVMQTNAKGLVWEAQTGTGDFEEISTDLADTYTVQKVAENTTYRVRTDGTEVCENAVSNTVSVQVEDSVKATLPDAATVCPEVENTILATVEGTPTAVSWGIKTDPDEIYTKQSETSLSYTDSPKQTTYYQFTAYATYCPNAVAVTSINVYEIPDLVVTPSATEICEGDNLDLTTDFDNPTTLVWYERFPDQIVASDIDAGSASTSLTPTQTYEYLVKGQTEGGCPVESKAVKVVVDEPVVAVTNDTTICEGDKARLISSPIKSEYSYLWSENADFSDTLSKNAAISVAPTENTTYYLRIFNGVCYKDFTEAVEVSSIPHITAIEDYGSRDLNFTAEGGTGSYQFKFVSDWQTSSIFSNIRFSTIYTAYVRDAVGCTSDTTFKTSTYDISVPEFFTPNGDLDNEVFEIKNIDKYPDAKISFYDRYGKLIYEGTGATYEGWDGTYNGYPLPSTDYWYEIYVYELYKTYTGHFTLLRSK